jgi:hypothetical protein
MHCGSNLAQAREPNRQGFSQKRKGPQGGAKAQEVKLATCGAALLCFASLRETAIRQKTQQLIKSDPPLTISVR